MEEILFFEMQHSQLLYYSRRVCMMPIIIISPNRSTALLFTRNQSFWSWWPWAAWSWGWPARSRAARTAWRCRCWPRAGGCRPPAGWSRKASAGSRPPRREGRGSLEKYRLYRDINNKKGWKIKLFFTKNRKGWQAQFWKCVWRDSPEEDKI